MVRCDNICFLITMMIYRSNFCRDKYHNETIIMIYLHLCSTILSLRILISPSSSWRMHILKNASRGESLHHEPFNEPRRCFISWFCCLILRRLVLDWIYQKVYLSIWGGRGVWGFEPLFYFRILQYLTPCPPKRPFWFFLMIMSCIED